MYCISEHTSASGLSNEHCKCVFVEQNLIRIQIHIHFENENKKKAEKTETAKTLPHALCKRIPVCSIALALPHRQYDEKLIANIAGIQRENTKLWKSKLKL